MSSGSISRFAVAHPAASRPSGHSNLDRRFQAANGDVTPHPSIHQRSQSKAYEIQNIQPPPKRRRTEDPVAATTGTLSADSRSGRTSRMSAGAPAGTKGVKQEPISACLDARTIMAIKEEQRSPSPLEPKARPVMSGTIRFHPLPHKCTHADPNYKVNRSYWARDQWKGALARNPNLKKGNAIIRDDGLAIDWSSPVPVWSDTLVSVADDPRDAVNEKENGAEKSGAKNESHHLRPLSKRAATRKPPSPEVIDVDALPSDDDVDGQDAYEPAYESEGDESDADECVEDGMQNPDEIFDLAESLEDERDVPGLREPPPTPVNGVMTEDDSLASILSPPDEGCSTKRRGKVPLEQLRAARRREAQLRTEKFLCRYIQKFERNREDLADAYTSYSQFSIRTHARDALGASRVKRYNCSSPSYSNSTLKAADIPRVTGRADIVDALVKLGPHTYFPQGKTFDLDYDHVFLANLDGTGDVLLSFYGEIALVDEDGHTGERLSVDQTMLLRESSAKDADESWPMVIISHQMTVKDVPWRRDTNPF
ncbi:hypothetical protein HDZ31DRAFT_36970 [Schizophyllum fasciatum]